MHGTNSAVSSSCSETTYSEFDIEKSIDFIDWANTDSRWIPTVCIYVGTATELV